MRSSPTTVAATKAFLATLERGASSPATLHSGYDVAQTTDNNSRHWENADGLSAKLAASPAVRKIIRDRARYEILENNCYAKGIVLTLANDTIGTGPRLQLRTEDADTNRQVERRYGEWADEVRKPEKLRMMRVDKGVSGETFSHFATNPLLRHPVKLDLIPSEADHFCSPLGTSSPWGTSLNTRVVDGIEYDENSNPVWYHRRKAHPGGDFVFVDPLASERLPADQVIHLYRRDRPDQLRGVCEFVTALSIFAQIRRWTQAELDAASFAASQNAVMRTNGSAVESPDDVDALDAIPFERNGLLTLPKGWDISQLKSEHPHPQSESFERRRVREIARCVCMPLIIALGDSSDANYSSGRLDHQSYFKAIWVERSYWECACLDRILLAWLKEASLIPGFLPDEIKALVRANQLPPHEWFWDGFQHVDPLKEATAQTIRLANGGTSRDAEYAMAGRDIDSEDERAAKSFGVSVEEYRRALFNKLFSIQPAAAGGNDNSGDNSGDNSSSNSGGDNVQAESDVDPLVPLTTALIESARQTANAHALAGPPVINVTVPAPPSPPAAEPKPRQRVVERNALGLITRITEDG